MFTLNRYIFDELWLHYAVIREKKVCFVRDKQFPFHNTYVIFLSRFKMNEQR